jgi:hypothetical protein
MCKIEENKAEFTLGVNEHFSATSNAAIVNLAHAVGAVR